MRYIFLLMVVMSLFACKDESGTSTSVDSKVEAKNTDETKKNSEYTLKVPVDKKDNSAPQQKIVEPAKGSGLTAEDRAGHERLKSDSDKRKAKEELAKNALKVVTPGQEKYVLNTLDPLPNACTFLTTDWIENYFRLGKGIVTVRNGSSPRLPHSNSCFFRWDDGGLPNSGVMVQIQRNPIVEEYPEWIKTFISNKKSQGETSFGGAPGEKITYKDFPGIGDEGCYTFEGNKYYWRKGEHIFMAAFNLGLKEKEQYTAAEKIAEQVMKRF